MTMREKIARAMYSSQNRDDDWIYHEDDGPVRAEYRAMADAVLDILMEPTRDMLTAFVDAETDLETVRTRYRAMIQAAKDGA